MALLYLTIDTVTGERKAVSPPGAPITEEFVSSGQTVFQLSTDISSTDAIKFFVDGRLMREGASHAWTRNATNNQIIASETVLAGKWVLVEVIKG